MDRTKENAPGAVQGTKGSESSPAKASDLRAQSNTDWRAWLDLEPIGWLTDGGEMTTDWTVA